MFISRDEVDPLIYSAISCTVGFNNVRVGDSWETIQTAKMWAEEFMDNNNGKALTEKSLVKNVVLFMQEKLRKEFPNGGSK